MTSLQIQYFLKVAECLSFSQAAESFFVSQPSVSRQIQQLERELGVPLFDRSRKNAVSLTAAGMVYRDAFRRSHQYLERATAAVRDLAGEAQLTLHIGIGQAWDMSDALLRARTLLQAQHPGARLEFEQDSFSQLHSRLEAGQLDAFLCTKISVQHLQGLEMMQVGELESRVYVRRGLLREEDKPLQLSDFNGHTLFMLPEEEAPMSLQIVLLEFLARQVQVHPLRLPNRDSIYQALLLGEGFSVFDQYLFLGRDPRLTYCRLEDVIPICLVWNRSSRNPLIRLFAQLLQQELERENEAKK
jgi:DNA-binding transcriptional LysR family regulator